MTGAYQLEVIYLVNGTTKVDTFSCGNANTTMAGQYGDQATYVQLTDGIDEQGRRIASILYRHAEKITKRERP